MVPTMPQELRTQVLRTDRINLSPFSITQEEAKKPRRPPVLIVARRNPLLLFVAQMAKHTLTNVKWMLPIVRISQRQSLGIWREHVNHNQAIKLGNLLIFGRRISSQIWHSLMSTIRGEYFIHSNKHKVRNRRNKGIYFKKLWKQHEAGADVFVYSKI